MSDSIIETTEGKDSRTAHNGGQLCAARVTHGVRAAVNWLTFP